MTAGSPATHTACARACSCRAPVLCGVVRAPRMCMYLCVTEVPWVWLACKRVSSQGTEELWLACAAAAEHGEGGGGPRQQLWLWAAFQWGIRLACLMQPLAACVWELALGGG